MNENKTFSLLQQVNTVSTHNNKRSNLQQTIQFFTRTSHLFNRNKRNIIYSIPGSEIESHGQRAKSVLVCQLFY